MAFAKAKPEPKEKSGVTQFGQTAALSEDQKAKALENALKVLKKDHGLGFVKLGQRATEIYPHVPTGIFGLDHDILGIGGFPKGRIIEAFGPASSGKTTLMLMLIAAVQAQKGNAAFVDAEHALDPMYAKALGVNTDELLVAQPDYGEQALQAVVDLVETRALDLIVVDSVAALTPKAELEGEMEDAHVGLQARMMGKALRKIAAGANKSGTIVAFLNQVRSAIGITFGNPETTPGGKALPFYASVRIDIRRIQQVKVGDENAGNRTKIKAAKNKMARPFREAEFDLMFGQGIDKISSLVDYAIEYGVFKKDGAQYTFKLNDDVITGRDNVKSYVVEENVVPQVTKLTLEAMGKTPDYIAAVCGNKENK